MSDKSYVLSEELRAELMSILEDVYEGYQGVSGPPIPIETLMGIFREPITLDVPIIPWLSPPFTDEDRSRMIQDVMSEIQDTLKGVAEHMLDGYEFLELVGYASPYDVDELVRMLQHLDNTEELYVTGEFLRESGEDEDDLPGQLDFAKRMGLINEEETELTELGKEFVKERI